MKQKIYYLASFFIPILILLFYIMILHGNLQSMFIGDLKEQYLFLFDYWKQILNQEQSLFYSFYIGLGESFLGTYAYYLASPFNWLLFFIPEKWIMSFLSILILVKIGLSGLTMYIYLKNTNENKERINLLFSICYALMGFNIIYHFNIMWLDVIIFTPIVMLGIERLIQKNDVKLYGIFLFLSILSQYYISFMLCIFCVIYFVYKSYLYNQLNKKTILKFIRVSIITGLLTSFFTVPLLYSISNTYRDNIGNNVTLIQKIANLFISFGIYKQRNAIDYNFPLLYCGLIQIVLIINFFLYEKDKKKKKITTIVLLIFLLSILSNHLIFLWHGGSYPYGLLYRFSFLISFFLISVCAQHYSNYQPFSHKQQFLFTFSYAFILLFGYFLKGNVDWLMLLTNLLFVTCNLLLLNICHFQRKKELALFLFVLVELFFHIKCNFVLSENLRLEDKPTVDNNRIEFYQKINQIGTNADRIDGIYYNYVGELIPIQKGSISLFLSSNNKNIFRFLNNAGYYVTSSSSYYNSNNFFLNSLLGLKYWYGKMNDERLEPVTTIHLSNREIPVYENPYALSLGYIVNENKSIHYENPFQYQNEFIEAITGESIYNPLQVKKIDDDTYEIKTDDSDYIDFYIEQEAKLEFYDLIVNIYVNEKFVKTKNGMEEILRIENDHPNEMIQVRLEYITKIEKNPTVYFYSEKKENLELLQTLKQKELNNIMIEKNCFSGDISIDEDSLLMLTIPYEKGFTIYVDGKKENIQIMYDTFVGVSLNKGKHHIELVYQKPYGFCLGVMITFSTIFFLVIKKIICYVKKSKV